MPRAYHPEERGTLECQLSNLADEIAYNTSDLDDGLRSGILEPAEVAELAIAKRTLASLGLPANANLRSDTVRYRFIRRLVGIEVSDAISATSAAPGGGRRREPARFALADRRMWPCIRANWRPKTAS